VSGVSPVHERILLRRSVRSGLTSTFGTQFIACRDDGPVFVTNFPGSFGVSSDRKGLPIASLLLSHFAGCLLTNGFVYLC
jgi:hypothetical protein